MAILPGVVASSPGYLLDGISGAYGAYSLRQLSGSVSNVCQCIRDSDSATQDFTAAELTDGTLTDFGSGTNVRIKTLYDQSGSNHATQSTLLSCPSVVISGTSQVDSSGLPWMNFDGSNDFIPLSSALPNIDKGNCSSFAVGKFDSTVAAGTNKLESILSLGTGGSARWNISAYDGDFVFAYASSWNAHTETQDTNAHVFTQIAGTTQGDWKCFIDGTEKDSATLTSGGTSGTYGIGGIYNTWQYELDGKVQEVIVFDSDQSSNRAAIEADIMGYYNL